MIKIMQSENRVKWRSLLMNEVKMNKNGVARNWGVAWTDVGLKASEEKLVISSAAKERE